MYEWSALLLKEHYHELLREAEHRQLVDQALATTAKRPGRYTRFMFRFGRLLVELGIRIQAYYCVWDPEDSTQVAR